MVLELPDDNRVVELHGNDEFYTYRGATRDARGTFDFLTGKISGLEAKVKYAKDFGLIIDVAKSSDCPEGKLAAATTEGSELQRLERGVTDLICAEKKIDELSGRRFPIQGGPSIPWRMIGPHDRQCRRNHCEQDLERIAERKGLSPAEALCVLDDQSWRESPWGNFMNDEAKSRAAHDELERRRAAFEDETVALREENERLREWRVNATAALQNEGGAHYEDVPNLIEALRMDLEKATEQLNDTIRSRGEIIQQRDEAQNDRDGATSRLNEARELYDQEHAEVERLKKAAVDCDFHILKCPVLAGDDLILLDPVDSIIEVAPGTDFGEGLIDEEGTVEKTGPDGVVKRIPYPDCTKFGSCPHKDDCPHYETEDRRCGRKAEDHVVRNPPLNLGPVEAEEERLEK